MRTSTIIVLAALALALALPAAAQDAASLTVQVRELELRQEASFLSPVVGLLHYGQQVAVAQRQGEWLQVTAAMGGQTGWAHASALTDEDLDLDSGSGFSGGADSDEVALAGKGFNQTVETEYRLSNPGMRYDVIDWMESINISPEEKQAFLDQGKAEAGGAQ